MGNSSAREHFALELDMLRAQHGIEVQGEEQVRQTTVDVPWVRITNADAPLLDVCEALPETGQSLQVTFGPAFADLAPLERVAIAAETGLAGDVYHMAVQKYDLQAILGERPLAEFAADALRKVEKTLDKGATALAPLSAQQLEADVQYYEDVCSRRGFAAARQEGRPLLRKTDAVSTHINRYEEYRSTVPDQIWAELQPGGLLDQLITGFTTYDYEKSILQASVLDYLSLEPHIDVSPGSAFKELTQFIRINYETFREVTRPYEHKNGVLGIRLMKYVFGDEAATSNRVKPLPLTASVRRAAGITSMHSKMILTRYYEIFAEEFGEFAKWFRMRPRPNGGVYPEDPLSYEWSEYGACIGRYDVMDYGAIRPNPATDKECDRTDHAKLNRAKRICQTSCPVLEQCREYGIRQLPADDQANLVLGGLSKRERNALRKARTPQTYQEEDGELEDADE